MQDVKNREESEGGKWDTLGGDSGITGRAVGTAGSQDGK